ncbi:hypothetical protein [Azohydromonas sediminis]|uniref:hypothetical protein n=1 Tax=Azohydromonas sediminis TaxID=2259674 RepID=UPI0013C2E9E3|nr:hypothetical protein [Azohydromonas sediminis]
MSVAESVAGGGPRAGHRGAAPIVPSVVLLLSVAPAAQVRRDAGSRARAAIPTAPAAAPVPAGLLPLDAQAVAAYREHIEQRQRRLLGDAYVQARRLRREPVGRMALDDGPAGPSDALAPRYADIWHLQHKSGASLWEVWLRAPAQPLDAARWTGWLDLSDERSLAARIWARLAPAGAPPEMDLPLIVLRVPGGGHLDDLLAEHAQALVKLLHRDPMATPFKASFVAEELAGDFCRREDGLSLLSRNAAIDLHLEPPGEACADAAADAEASGDAPMPRNTLPLLVTLELLCLERGVLRGLLDRSQAGRVGTIDELVALRRDMIDGLEEYYGTLARTHGYTAEATARGEALFGIDALFDSVVDRMEALTFEITTRNQQTVNRIGFWLTILFGAIETGFVASGIATWYYADDLPAVLSWTIGVTLLTASAIAVLLVRVAKADAPVSRPATF